MKNLIFKKNNMNDFVIENNVLKKYIGKDRIVRIPDGVEIVGYKSFENCDWIRKVIFPDSVKKIGEYAFKGCEKLNVLKISPLLKDIWNMAFKGCKGLADKNGFVIVNGTLFDYFGNDEVVKVPDNVIKISDDTFEGYECIKKVILPEGLKWLGCNVFKNCKNLESINIPSYIMTWGNGAFRGCKKLADENGFVIDRNNKLIMYYGNDRIVRIPDGVTSIHFNAFDYCESMEFVVIPTSIKKIGEVCGIRDSTIICAEDSYAAEYAEEYGMAYIEIPEDEFQSGLTQEDIEEYIEQYQKEKEGLSL